jgi:hypothetical protein
MRGFISFTRSSPFKFAIFLISLADCVSQDAQFAN